MVYFDTRLEHCYVKCSFETVLLDFNKYFAYTDANRVDFEFFLFTVFQTLFKFEDSKENFSY